MQHEMHFCYVTSLQSFDYGDVVHQQDLRRQTPQTRFLLDIYVLKTMIYFLNRVSLRKSCKKYKIFKVSTITWVRVGSMSFAF
ncbi:MAG: hypothetical protein O4860_00475 [Trichodesmium sp. St2_bin2_1]|nr:hypothetical protein [Trichodesmium sp. St2_bin2_1]